MAFSSMGVLNMATLAGSQVRRLVEAKELLIEPFLEELVQPATYDLRLGAKILASPLSKDILGAKVELGEQKPIFNIQSGQMVAVISEERLEVPLNVCARFGIRSEHSRVGLVDFGGLQIDPGFKGHLTLSLLNVGPEPVPLALRKPFFSVEFNFLDEPAEVGYQGTNQGQQDFPADQYDFILHARTTSLAGFTPKWVA